MNQKSIELKNEGKCSKYFFNKIKMFSTCNFEFERRKKKKREGYMCVLGYERLAQFTYMNSMFNSFRL